MMLAFMFGIIVGACGLFLLILAFVCWAVKDAPKIDKELKNFTD
jgi:hypothetical protein